MRVEICVLISLILPMPLLSYVWSFVLSTLFYNIWSFALSTLLYNIWSFALSTLFYNIWSFAFSTLAVLIYGASLCARLLDMGPEVPRVGV